MICLYILLYICVASSISIYEQLDNIGITINTKYNKKLILQDNKAVFASVKTPVWALKNSETEEGAVSLLPRKNLMNGVIIKLLEYGQNLNVENKIEPLPPDEIDRIKERMDITCSRTNILRNGISGSSPKAVYPEILVFVHYNHFKKFINMIELITYVLTLLNGVDLNFRTMTRPKVRLNIAGIVVAKEPINQHYVDNLVFSQCMDKLKSDGVRYDIAILIKSKMKDRDKCEPISSDACSGKDEINAVIYDDMKFSGIRYLTIALAYLFGVGRDGSGYSIYSGGPVSADCPDNHGYLMGIPKTVINQFLFSQCSLNMMSYFFSLDIAKCLLNKPRENLNDKQMLRILPGKYMTLDEQCQIMGYVKAYETNSSNCLKIKCLNENQEPSSVETHPLEGSACSPKMHCIRGECIKVEMTEHVGDINLTHFLAQHFSEKHILGYNAQELLAGKHVECSDKIERSITIEDGEDTSSGSLSFSNNSDLRLLFLVFLCSIIFFLNI